MPGNPHLPAAQGATPRQVAIVGLNRETANLLPSLMEAEGIQVVKVLNPELDEIIDTTHNATTAARLRKLPLKKVDVISGMGARILFCAAQSGTRRSEDK